MRIFIDLSGRKHSFFTIFHFCSYSHLVENLLLLVGITGLLGLASLFKAAYTTLGIPFPTDSGALGYLMIFSGLMMGVLAGYVYRLRRTAPQT